MRGRLLLLLLVAVAFLYRACAAADSAHMTGTSPPTPPSCNGFRYCDECVAAGPCGWCARSGKCEAATGHTCGVSSSASWRGPGSTSCLPAQCSLTLAQTVAYGALALASLLSLALGYRLFRVIVSLVALSVGGGVAWLALAQYAPHASLGLRIAGAVAGAAVALLAAHSAIRTALAVLGAVAGIVVCGVVLSVPGLGSTITSGTSVPERAAGVAAIALLGAGLAVVAERTLLILSTSWLGAYGLFVAVDVFLAAAGVGCGARMHMSSWQSGYFRASITRVLYNLQIYAYEPPPAPADTVSFYTLVAAFCLTTVLGVALQEGWTIGVFHHRHGTKAAAAEHNETTYLLIQA